MYLTKCRKVYYYVVITEYGNRKNDEGVKMEKVAVYLTKEEINFLWAITQSGLTIESASELFDIADGLDGNNLRDELARGAHYHLTK